MNPKADMRQRILAAALKRFAQKGWHVGQGHRDVRARLQASALLLFQKQGGPVSGAGGLGGRRAVAAHAEAASRSDMLAERLTELCASLFEFARTHRELMRLTFGTALAASGEGAVRGALLREGLAEL